MECRNTSAIVSSISAGGALLTAVGFCIAAGIANASFFGAPGAPVLMGTSLGFAIAALVGAGVAKSFFSQFEQCVKANTPCYASCRSEFSQAHSALLGAGAAISAAVALIVSAIPISWIPWAGEVPIGIALIGLFAAIAALSHAIYLMRLAEACVLDCLSAEPPSKVIDVVSVAVYALAIAATVTTVGVGIGVISQAFYGK